jgi:hypothetical protein
MRFSTAIVYSTRLPRLELERDRPEVSIFQIIGLHVDLFLAYLGLENLLAESILINSFHRIPTVDQHILHGHAFMMSFHMMLETKCLWYVDMRGRCKKRGASIRSNGQLQVYQLARDGRLGSAGLNFGICRM